MSLDRLTVRDPLVIVLAGGRTPSDANNNRGHLLEQFVAQLLNQLGYAAPNTINLNSTADGIELDVRATHSLTGKALVAECKVYAKNLRAETIKGFYGALSKERLDDPDLFGLFVGLPRLVAEGHEFVNKVVAKDANFRCLTAESVFGLLLERGLVSLPTAEGRLLADYALLVAEEGVYTAARELDPSTRGAKLVRVWAKAGVVPEPVLRLLRAHEYANELSVVQATSGVTLAGLREALHEAAVTRVVGSSSDFEYQLPAAPEFFVGRDEQVGRLSQVLASEGPQIVVVNAKSGWGKSSFALRMAQVVRDGGGCALVLDSRTATTPSFVTAAVRTALDEAQNAGICALSDGAAFSSVASTLATLRDSVWSGRRLLIFFDQFENVFRSRQITAEFSALSLGLRELRIPVSLAFAWKTDLVGWTEDHPYELRDAIRSAATVVSIPQFGSSEVSTLLARLEQAQSVRLRKDLRERIHEVSQGLPWLFKKLASHVGRELAGGTTQEQLLSESLNALSLFDADLSELEPEEEEALRHIARSAPVKVSEAIEAIGRPRLQTLLDRRLVVQVGERLDTYWDIFRDFLNTGRPPELRDGYILRQTPISVVRFLQELVRAGGHLAVADAALRLATTDTVVFNVTRDLRLLGLLTGKPGEGLHLRDEVLDSEDREEQIRQVVATSLRRHRIQEFLDALYDQGRIPSAEVFAAELPAVFPAVAASKKTWTTYGRAFFQWCEYAGLLPAGAGETQNQMALLTTPPKSRAEGSFPQGPPGPCVALLRHIRDRASAPPSSQRANVSAARDLLALGAAEIAGVDELVLANPRLFDVRGDLVPEVLLGFLERVPGGEAALGLIRARPGVSSVEVGSALAEGHEVDWAPSTCNSAGKHFRGWARLAGLPISNPRIKGGAQMTLLRGP